MAETQAFDSEMERIGDALVAMREAFEPPASMLAEAVESLILPEEAKLAIEAERFKASGPGRQAVEAALAHLVAGLAAEIEFRACEFDMREVPTRFEKLIGLVSRSAMRRRQLARSRRSVSLDHLAELLRRADRLAALVRAERVTLLAQRSKGEADLKAFIDHRPDIIEKLHGENGEAMTGVEAARRTEHFVAVFQTFIDGLNAGVGTCNVLMHKLLIDVEDLLILYQVFSEVVSRYGDKDLRPEDFPNLFPEIERFSKGMLSVHGLDRRRDLANEAFAERFPAEAVRQAAAVAHPAGAGWRLPAISDLKFIRP